MASGERRGVAAPSGELSVTFYGVRGSTPCCSPSVNRYGGNTSTVVIEAPGELPLLLDLGTGAREFGMRVPPDGPFRCRALVSHLHWDHVQGLPFFRPVLRPGAELELYAPAPGSGLSLAEALDRCIRPPFFPVTLAELPGTLVLREVDTSAALELDGLTVRARPVPHVGPTVGYRVEWCGVSVAYIPDHQQPVDASTVDESVLELAAGVDLLIHDAQYTGPEFDEKATWGHSTVDYAVEVARRAGVRTLALFHHDPLHDDDTVDALLEGARVLAGPDGPAVVAAAEGMRLTWSGRPR